MGLALKCTNHNISNQSYGMNLHKGCLDFPYYCLCFEPVKARRQKPTLMVCPHAGLPGWLAPTRLKEFE